MSAPFEAFIASDPHPLEANGSRYTASAVVWGYGGVRVHPAYGPLGTEVKGPL